MHNTSDLRSLLGFHASHEQFAPSELLRLASDASGLGVQHAMCSDHIAPFSEAQGQSGFAWSWLGAALQATQMSFGTVTAPGQRYHPVIIAQAVATLSEMYPGRFWVALGSGEYINEHVTAEYWPAKSIRRKRLAECVSIMRALLAGETVTHEGLVRVDQARLYTRPAQPPPFFGAAVSPESAAWVAGWADGLITVSRPHEQLRQVVDAFRQHGGAGKPMYLQVHLSLAESEQAALDAAHDQWRAGALAGDLMWNTRHPEELDQATRFIKPEDLRSAIRIYTRLERQLDDLGRDQELGFERVYLHQVGRDQRAFVAALGKLVSDR
jgi:coenzyme F420-dependent glucose-6-phosphate dehydrogenase